MNKMQSKTLPWCLLFILLVAVFMLSVDNQLQYGLRNLRRLHTIYDPKTTVLKDHLNHVGAETSLRSRELMEAISIKMNEKTTLISDIKSISHIPSSAAIKIQLNVNRNCLKPVFRARLSGPSLAIVKWEDIDLEKHELIGHYNVPYAGKYFFEIVTLLCNELQFDQDFTDVCLEDVFHHRVTVDESTIDVVQINHLSGEMGDLGSWVYTREKTHQNYQYGPPLYTRIQPDMCMNEIQISKANPKREPRNIPPLIFSPLSDQQKEQCSKYEVIRHFQFYHFKWNERIKEEFRLHNERNKICFVGASHSRILAKDVARLRGEIDIDGNSETVGRVHMLYHRQFNEETWDRLLIQLKCKRIVIGLGQYPASYWDHRPKLFHEYNDDTKHLIHSIVSKRERLKLHGADVYLRSMHHSSLMNAVAGTCPPYDWRSPPVTDGYNSIQRKLCMQYDIPFIDTNFLIDPVWDSAKDWVHLNPKLSSYEANYIIMQTSLLARNSVVQAK